MASAHLVSGKRLTSGAHEGLYDSRREDRAPGNHGWSIPPIQRGQAAARQGDLDVAHQSRNRRPWGTSESACKAIPQASR